MSKIAAPRFLALDVFRGMTVCFMIIVNTPGNYETTLAPLLHANWHGFTPTDLVFPSFLFAVGNAMAFVFPKWEGMPQSAVLRKILKRTAIIFLLGYLMYWFPFMRWDGNQFSAFPFSETRVFGVLQRIALCYGITALLIYYLKPKATYIITIILLLLYWFLMVQFGSGTDPYSLEGNAVLRLDKWLIGEKHMYHGDGIAFDPEGLLGTLPSIANVVFGYWAGELVRKKGQVWETVAMLLLAAALFLFVAYCWDPFFPINKKLWTSSYVMLTVGIDLALLAVLIYIIEFRKMAGWTSFFTVFGKNPLFIYLLSEVIAILLWFFKTSDGKPYYNHLYEKLFSYLGPYTGSLAFALFIMMVCWLVGWWMNKRKIYVRV